MHKTTTSVAVATKQRPFGHFHVSPRHFELPPPAYSAQELFLFQSFNRQAILLTIFPYPLWWFLPRHIKVSLALFWTRILGVNVFKMIGRQFFIVGCTSCHDPILVAFCDTPRTPRFYSTLGTKLCVHIQMIHKDWEYLEQKNVPRSPLNDRDEIGR